MPKGPKQKSLTARRRIRRFLKTGQEQARLYRDGQVFRFRAGSHYSGGDICFRVTRSGKITRTKNE